MATTCCLVHLGLTPYKVALLLQRRLAALRADGCVGDLLLLLQHTPVITLGRGGQRAHLLVEESTLAPRGIEFFEVERGGEITYHGPGQLIGYPIVDLAEYGRDLHRYLRLLEGVLIGALGAFGIDAGRWSGRTGVWARGKKIGSIGIHVSRWVTRHGFALNVDMDLAPFELIVPCGIKDAKATSMAEELSHPLPMDQVTAVVAERFGAAFEVCLVPTPLTALLNSIGILSEDLSTSSFLLEAITAAPLE